MIREMRRWLWLRLTLGGRYEHRLAREFWRVAYTPISPETRERFERKVTQTKQARGEDATGR
jgi:hypothetical protein